MGLPSRVMLSRRSEMGKNTRVYWTPRVPIVKYAVYTHERSWIAPADEVRDVLCTELICRHKVA